MPSGGGGSQTMRAEPWGPSQPGLQRGINMAGALLDDRRLAPSPFTGDRMADMTAAQSVGMGNVLDAARAGAPGVADANMGLRNMLDGLTGGQTNTVAGMGLGALGRDFGGFDRAAALGPDGLADMGGRIGSGQFGAASTLGITGGGDQARMAGGVGREQFAADHGALGMADARTYRDLDAVRSNALGRAIPAALAPFIGSGMTDSTMAMDTVGRAAAEAVAPIEYGAFDAAQSRNAALLGQNRGLAAGSIGNAAAQAGDAMRFGTGFAGGVMGGNQAQDFAREQAALGRGVDLAGLSTGNILRAGALAPGLDAARYAPGQMQMQVGGMQQGQAQAEINARMQADQERDMQAANNLAAYSNMLLGYGGMGGTTTQPGGGGASPFGAIAGGGLQGLGMYAALATNPATAGVALPIGIGAGALGALGGLWR